MVALHETGLIKKLLMYKALILLQLNLARNPNHIEVSANQYELQFQRRIC